MFPDDRITISVVGRLKARHFHVSHTVLRGLSIVGGAVMLAGAFIGAVKLLSYTSPFPKVEAYVGEVTPTRAALLASVERSRTELESALHENAALRSDAARHQARLEESDHAVQATLRPAGTTSAAVKGHVTPAAQTSLRNTFLLQHVPSGSPVDFKGVSSPFGLRQHPISNERKMHEGVDLRADYSTPVVATADGLVEFAGFQDRDGYGRLVTLSHDFGFKSSYAHLSRVTVNVGDYVAKGRIIAYTGNSGLSSGPHLHYEVQHLQRKLDPAPFLQWSPENFNTVLTGDKSIRWDSLLALATQQAQRLAQQLSANRLVSSAN